MKKCFLVLLSVWAIQTSYSQTEKGKMFIGGSGQINLSGNKVSNLDASSKSDNNTFGFSIAPNYGYFIKDNFAIGANINLGVSNSTQNLNYNYINQTPPSTYTNKSNTLSYGIGGFACYYLNITDNFKCYFNGGVSYLYSTQKVKLSNNDPTFVYGTNDPENQEIQTNNISFAFSPGFVYFLTPKIGIQTTFGNIYYNYSSSKNKSLFYDNRTNTGSYGIDLNLSTFSLGMNYYF